MTKEDLIKAAWGKHYDHLNEQGSLDSNGVVIIGDWRHLPSDINYTPYINSIGKMIRNSYYPIALKGIENNNGWIKILPDGYNLPEDGDYYFYDLDDPKDDGENYFTYRQHSKNDFIRWFTHYRPKNKFPKPLY